MKNGFICFSSRISPLALTGISTDDTMFFKAVGLINGFPKIVNCYTISKLHSIGCGAYSNVSLKLVVFFRREMKRTWETVFPISDHLSYIWSCNYEAIQGLIPLGNTNNNSFDILDPLLKTLV